MSFMLWLAIWAAGVSAQATRPAQSAGDGKVIVDNDRVTVRDIRLQKGQSPRINMDQDAVVVYLNEATAGDVVFAGKGDSLKNDGRAIVIGLKDRKVAPFKNLSGYPNAFPRPGVKKVLENDRVIAWDYTWTPGVPTPIHFHDKDVVVVYLADGALTSTTPDGVATVNEHSFGFTKFNPGNRVHTETLSRGGARAIIVELE